MNSYYGDDVRGFSTLTLTLSFRSRAHCAADHLVVCLDDGIKNCRNVEILKYYKFVVLIPISIYDGSLFLEVTGISCLPFCFIFLVFYYYYCQLSELLSCCVCL